MLRTIFPRGDTKAYLPVNLRRIIWNAQKKFEIDLRKKCPIAPSYIVKELENLSKKLVIVDGEDKLSKEAQLNATMLFNIHLRSTFCTKKSNF